MTGPNPEKVTMTERTYLPLENDIRKMQINLQDKIRKLRKKFSPKAPTGFDIPFRTTAEWIERRLWALRKMG